MSSLVDCGASKPEVRNDCLSWRQRSPYRLWERPSQGWRCALVIILWASGLQFGLYAQHAAKLSPKVMAVINAPPLDLKDDDPPLLQLERTVAIARLICIPGSSSRRDRRIQPWTAVWTFGNSFLLAIAQHRDCPGMNGAKISRIWSDLLPRRG
jgi:hypothetical protein